MDRDGRKGGREARQRRDGVCHWPHSNCKHRYNAHSEDQPAIESQSRTDVKRRVLLHMGRYNKHDDDDDDDDWGGEWRLGVMGII